MPHFIVEYSTNLGQTDESIDDLFAELHQAADKTGLFPFKGLRGRAYPCDQYRMADGNPQHGFALLEVKLGVGRSLEDRESAAKIFFEIFTDHFAEQTSKHFVPICMLDKSIFYFWVAYVFDLIEMQHSIDI